MVYNTHLKIIRVHLQVILYYLTCHIRIFILNFPCTFSAIVIIYFTLAEAINIPYIVTIIALKILPYLLEQLKIMECI